MTDPTNRPSPGQRRVLLGVSVALGLVILAPIVLSTGDLYYWAKSPTGLNLKGIYPYLVPVALDVAAAACIGMTVVCTWRRERPGVFGVLVWVFAGASAYAQFSHGKALAEIGLALDAVWAMPAFALLGPLLLEVTLARLRRWYRIDAAELHSGAAGFGSRWIPGVAFRETLRAWAASRREGIAQSGAAVAFVREVDALRGLSQVDAIRYAWSALGTHDPYPARVWLQARGVQVDQAAIDEACEGLPPAVPVPLVIAPPLPPVHQPAPLPIAPPAPAPAELVTEPAGPASSAAPAIPAPSLPVSPAPAGNEPSAYHLSRLAGLPVKRDKIRYAFNAIGSYDVAGALAWLAAYGVSVRKSEVQAVASSASNTGEFPRINGHAATH